MKRFLISFLVSFVIISIAGYYFFFLNDRYTHKEEVPVQVEEVETEEVLVEEENNITIDEPVVEEKNILDTFEDHEVTFLMLGVDALEGDKENIRTDTMMVFNCNFDTGKIKVLSIPRDTRLMLRGKMDKINHAHSYGGVELSLDTVNEFLDTDIEYYLKIDYRAVEEIVDAIGGVDIFVPRRMEYYDPSVDFRVDLYKGQQILDGNKAMQFLRWRSNNAMTLGYVEGDVGRIETQQYFLKEFVKQTLVPKNFLKLPFLARTYLKRVDTNIPMMDIINGMRLARNLDSESMETYTVPGYGTYVGEISYFIVNQRELKDLLIELEL